MLVGPGRRRLHLLAAGVSIVGSNAAWCTGTTSADTPIVALIRSIEDDAALAAASLQGPSVVQLRDVFATQSARLSRLEELDNTVAQCAVAIASAKCLVRNGGMTSRRAQALTSRRAELEEALAAREAILQEFRGVVLAFVEQASGTELSALAQRMMQNAGRTAPSAFKCLDLGPAAWGVLESAWRKAVAGESLTETESVALATTQSSALVQAVQSRIDSNLPSIRAVIAEQIAVAAQAVSGPQ